MVKVAWRPDPQSLAVLIPRYAAREFSYSEVGATQGQRLPDGYHHVVHTVALGTEQLAFELAAKALTAWAMHRRAGLVVAASADQAAVGVTTVMGFGTRLAGLVIPCRVVWTLDEPDQRGFAYGTLTGHPESGEEAFTIERVDGSVTLSIRAFSKPGNGLVRAGSSVSRLIQSRMTNRYGRSLAELLRA